MYRLFLLSLLCLVGCQGVRGPLQPKDPQRVDDPGLPISEQQRRGRERLPLPDESSNIAPRIPAAGTPYNVPR